MCLRNKEEQRNMESRISAAWTGENRRIDLGMNLRENKAAHFHQSIHRPQLPWDALEGGWGTAPFFLYGFRRLEGERTGMREMAWC